MKSSFKIAQIALLVLISSIFSTAKSQDSFTVYIKRNSNQKGHLQYSYTSLDGVRHQDVLYSETNEYHIKGKLESPTLINMRFVPSGGEVDYETYRREQYKLLVDGVLTYVDVSDYLDGATVRGSALQNEYLVYRRGIDGLHRKMQIINMKKQKIDASVHPDSARFYERSLDTLHIAEAEYLMEFISKKPNSPLSLIAVSDYNRPSAIPKTLAQIFAALDPKLQNTGTGKKLFSSIEETAAAREGNIVPNFGLPDVDGKLVELDSFKGRYILLDFWASWCTPCRKEHPSMRKIYQNYKKRGFEIISISLDTSRDNWLKAIREDQVGDWYHISDLKGSKTTIAQALNVKAIPFNVLLSPDGKILAKNLHGIKLADILEKLIE